MALWRTLVIPSLRRLSRRVLNLHLTNGAITVSEQDLKCKTQYLLLLENPELYLSVEISHF